MFIISYHTIWETNLTNCYFYLQVEAHYLVFVPLGWAIWVIQGHGVYAHSRQASTQCCQELSREKKQTKQKVHSIYGHMKSISRTGSDFIDCRSPDSVVLAPQLHVLSKFCETLVPRGTLIKLRGQQHAQTSVEIAG